MSRYADWFHKVGYEGASSDAIDEAQRLLGLVMSRARAYQMGTYRMQRELGDGTVITASYGGGQPRVEIVSPVLSTTPNLHSLVKIWIPSGFILYPASDTAPRGWGTPVIQDVSHGVTAYSPPNLAPGLDPTRWTVGGRLGEVLFTKVTKAGYPAATSLIPPLLFSNTRGLKVSAPYKAPPLDLKWSAYRMEFADFTSQSPGATAIESLTINGNKRIFFERVNAHRAGIGRDAWLLPIRGRADTAQATAEVQYATSTQGHDYVGYPDTYKASSDRTSKDGLVGFLNPTGAASRDLGDATMEQVASLGTVVHSYPDPTGFPSITVEGGGDIDPGTALALYLAEPAHKTGIEAQLFNGHHASVQFGFKHAFNALHVFPNTSWVHAGNRCWNSKFTEIPPLSIFGFSSLNLAYETWTVTFNNTTRPGGGWGVHPTPPMGYDPLVVNGPLRESATSAFWLSTYYGYDPSFVYDQTPDPVALNFSAEQIPCFAPTWDNRIFMRGRCIAVAPPAPGATTAGWVMAAAVQKFDSPDADHLTVYRLVALVHHEEDQPTGTTNQKLYGMTAYMRIWYCDLPNDSPIPCNPHSLIREAYGQENHGWPWDVVNSPYSWRGGELVDVGTTDGSARDSLKYASQWVFSSDGMHAVCLRDVGTAADYIPLWNGYRFGFPEVIDGLYPRALQLDFGGNAFNPLTVTKSWRGQNAGHTPYNNGVGSFQVDVKAAGFDAEDNATFASVVSYESGDEQTFIHAISFGAYDMMPMDTPTTNIFNAVPDPSALNMTTNVFCLMVMDIKEQVFAAAGEYPTYVSIAPVRNPLYQTNWLNQSLPVGNVKAWRMGQLLNTTPFNNPDATVFDVSAYQCGSVGTYLNPANCRLVIPSYASNGTDWAFSFVIVPQSPVCTYFPDSISTCPDPNVTGLSPTAGASGFVSIDPLTFKPACRGGWVTSSFADTGALATLTQTPGTNPRSLYARVV